MRKRVATIVVASALLAGCAADASPDSAMTEPPSSVVPPGAVKIGDETYMVPITKGEDGCMQYRMHAPGRMVPQVIFYADGKGGFTMNRAEASCPPPNAPDKAP